MSNINFDSKASSYEQNSLVQTSASKILLNLLDVKINEDALDLGCGPGNITKIIGTITNGKVLGVDVSKYMIDEALRTNTSPNVFYSVKDSEHLSFENEFDIIYCNSAFRNLVKEAIKEQTDINGMVDLQFNRIYLTATKN